MLKVTSVGSPIEKIELLRNFDHKNVTWVVSDLKSKLEIQNRRLQNTVALAEDSILRVNELWRALMLEHYPDWQIVSSDYIRTLIQSQIESLDIDWINGANSGHRMMQMMNQFIPLLVWPEEDGLVKEWLEAHPESRLRWSHWYELSQSIWDHLHIEKVLPSAWLPSFLLSHEVKLTWPRDLIVDLNSQMTHIEAELFKRIAVSSNVQILKPEAEWQGAFRSAIESYDGFEVDNQVGLPKWEDFKLSKKIKTRHFTTSLAEVKDSVAQVREWLEAGVRAEKIMIVAPQIEGYWSLLAPLLKEEGIPVSKSRQRPIHSFLNVQTWLARIRLKLGIVHPEDIELAAFEAGTSLITVEEFRRLFTHFYSEEQLQLDQTMAQRFKKEWNSNETVTRDEFVWRAASVWGSEDLETLEYILNRLLSDGRESTQLTLRLWISWLESWLAKIEFEVAPALKGIECLNVSAAEWVDASHLYFLGLSEDELTQSQGEGLNSSEVETLRRDLGLALPKVEQTQLEFESRWLLSVSREQTIMSCAKVDVEGGPVTPARLWLLQNERLRDRLARFDLPKKVRWDEIQKSSLSDMAKIRNWPDEHLELLKRGMDEDFGLKPLPSFHSKKRRGVSASSLEAYAECPFVFAATRLFLLQDLPSLDLDLSPMASGQMIHKIFEKLLVEPVKLEMSESEIASIVEAARSEEKVLDLGLWEKQKSKLIESARRFLEFEKQWRKLYPETHTLAREISFDVAWSMSASDVVSKDKMSESDFELRGRVDRVDTDKKGNYVVLDYKSTGSNSVGAETWLARDAFQLAIYQRVVSLGLTELPAGEVQGAFYYIVSEMKRSKGIHIKEPSSLLPDKGAPKSAVTREKAEAIWNQIRQRITDILQHIDEGVMTPQPKKDENCPTCAWRQLCRAPHLQ